MRDYPNANPPWPPPLGPYDPTGMRYNPGQTIPYPMPKNVPVGLWSGDRAQLVFGAGVAPVVRTASWGSPLFDLRPDLRSSDGFLNKGIPLWHAGYGGTGKLWIQLANLRAAPDNTEALQVTSQEFAHIYDADQVQAVSGAVDITADVISGTDGPPSVVIGFLPIGDGYPVRYWRINLTFDRMATFAADPVITVCAAYY